MGDVALCNSPRSVFCHQWLDVIAIVLIDHLIVVILGQEELTAYPLFPNILIRIFHQSQNNGIQIIFILRDLLCYVKVIVLYIHGFTAFALSVILYNMTFSFFLSHFETFFR